MASSRFELWKNSRCASSLPPVNHRARTVPNCRVSTEVATSLAAEPTELRDRELDDGKTFHRWFLRKPVESVTRFSQEEPKSNPFGTESYPPPLTPPTSSPLFAAGIRGGAGGRGGFLKAHEFQCPNGLRENRSHRRKIRFLAS